MDSSEEIRLPNSAELLSDNEDPRVHCLAARTLQACFNIRFRSWYYGKVPPGTMGPAVTSRDQCGLGHGMRVYSARTCGRNMRKSDDRRAKGRPNSAEPGVGRDAIVTATRALLASQNHAKLSLRELARALNVDPGLIRYYFGNKEGLYAEVVQEVLEENRRRHQKVIHSKLPPEQKLQRRISIYLDIISENPFLHSLFLDIILHGKGPDTAQYRHQAVSRAYLELRQLMASSGAAISGQPVDARFFTLLFWACVNFM